MTEATGARTDVAQCRIAPASSAKHIESRKNCPAPRQETVPAQPFETCALLDVSTILCQSLQALLSAPDEAKAPQFCMFQLHCKLPKGQVNAEQTLHADR